MEKARGYYFRRDINLPCLPLSSSCLIPFPGEYKNRVALFFLSDPISSRSKKKVRYLYTFSTNVAMSLPHLPFAPPVFVVGEDGNDENAAFWTFQSEFTYRKRTKSRYICTYWSNVFTGDDQIVRNLDPRNWLSVYCFHKYLRLFLINFLIMYTHVHSFFLLALLLISPLFVFFTFSFFFFVKLWLFQGA